MQRGEHLLDVGRTARHALFPIAFSSIFVAVGLPAMIEALARLRVAKGPDAALVVDEEGVAMTGMDRLRWAGLDQLDADPDDVIDHIARYRVVVEE